MKGQGYRKVAVFFTYEIFLKNTEKLLKHVYLSTQGI